MPRERTSVLRKASRAVPYSLRSKPLSEVTNKEKATKVSKKSARKLLKSPIVRRFEESVEDELASEYTRGGYCVLKTGDRLDNNRYTVIRKIGSGISSTVWLCADLLERKYAAVKVFQSNATFQGNKEFRLMNYLSEKFEHLKKIGLMTSKQRFTVNDEFGTHICLVFPFLAGNFTAKMCDTSSCNNDSGLKLIKSVLRQLFRGLKVLHNDCSMIHSDLKPENILFDSGDMAFTTASLLHNQILDDLKNKRTLSKTAVCNLSSNFSRKLNFLRGINGAPESKIEVAAILQEARVAVDKLATESEEKAPTRKSKKRKADDDDVENHGSSGRNKFRRVEKTCAGNRLQSRTTTEMNKDDIRITLSDFGLARKVSEWDGRLRKRTTTTSVDSDLPPPHSVPYRSPECILGGSFGKECDIWAAALMSFELATQEMLVKARYKETDTITLQQRVDHIISLEDNLGPIPKALKTSVFIHAENIFNKIKSSHKHSKIYEKLRRHGWSETAAKELAKFLKFLLEYDPSKRPTAEQVLQHNFLAS